MILDVASNEAKVVPVAVMKGAHHFIHFVHVQGLLVIYILYLKAFFHNYRFLERWAKTLI